MAISRKGIGLFIGGALVGAAAGLLLAPAAGTETRKKVGGWLKKKTDEGKQTLEKAKLAGKKAYEDFQTNGAKEKVAA